MTYNVAHVCGPIVLSPGDVFETLSFFALLLLQLPRALVLIAVVLIYLYNESSS